MIVADTSGLLPLYNQREPAPERVRSAVEADADTLIVSPFVIAELDHLTSTRLGVDAALALIRELASGAYELAAIDEAALRCCAEVVERYRDQSIGVADASLVVLADRYDTTRIVTLDRRRFGVVRPLRGGRFTIIGG